MGTSSDMDRFDIIIAGGGLTGMTMAHALAKTLGNYANIALIDRNAFANAASEGAPQAPSAGPAGAPAPNGSSAAPASPPSAPLTPVPPSGPLAPVPPSGPLAMALSAGTKQMLEVLGVWAGLADNAQAVSEIEITDSSLDATIRPGLLHYQNRINGDGPASYIVENRHLQGALRRAIAGDRAITALGGRGIDHFAADENGVAVMLENGDTIKAALLITADGRRSKLRQQAGIKTIDWDHEQIGIVTIVTHDKPHNGRAVQHFLPAGPFAILPLKADAAGRSRSCITWSEAARRGRQIMALDDDGFRNEVQKRFGHKLGEVTLEAAQADAHAGVATAAQASSPLRAAWPLTTHLARGFIARRFALVGDAAHGVHPIAGQGLNLAMRDVAALSEVLKESSGLGLDLGGGDALERYERWRRFDSALSAAAFSGLNKLFSNDSMLLRTMRDAGLGMVDRLPGLKSFFVREAAGLTGEVPKLLKGEMI